MTDSRQVPLLFDGEEMELPDAEIRFYAGFFGSDEADMFLDALMKEINWKQDSMPLYGRMVKLPRETAWYGDQGKSYAFSGMKLDPNPWTENLREIKDRIEQAQGMRFNSVLLNRYRDGNDSVSWHSDSEPELGRNPVVASVSLGATRTFMLKHKRKGIMKNVELVHGILLLMTGPTQHHWVHQIPKTSRRIAHDIGPRINLTFRRILSGNAQVS